MTTSSQQNVSNLQISNPTRRPAETYGGPLHFIASPGYSPSLLIHPDPPDPYFFHLWNYPPALVYRS